MRRLLAAVAVWGVVLAGCDDGGTGPEVEDVGTFTLDSSEGWAFADLGEPATEVEVVDPASSEAWDIGFNGTAVMLNGGDVGPGDVAAYCICQNADATDDEVMAMTPAAELADFEAVTAADIPVSEDQWTQDVIDPVIEGWYSYDPQTHVVSADPSRVWKVRTAEGTGYAKLHVTDISNPSQADAGQVTLEFAVQEEAGAAMGPVETLTVDVSSGPVYVDLLTGSVSDESDWDLLLSGYMIQLNGGVSGSGGAGAWAVEEEFAAITDASDAQDSRQYRADGLGGVFAADADDAVKFYRYDLAGEHHIWPTFNVYLIRTGEGVYKMQVVNYYDEVGEARHITFRYELLEE